jgi:Protein of unknown function (DUF3617)
MRFVAFVGIAAIAACAASADTLKDGSVQVKPGRYNWKQETSVVGVPINEENLECLIPQKSRVTLSKLANDLDEGCTVDNVVPTSTGYTFKLICSGKTKGKADATLTHTETSMSIRAKGSAQFLGLPAGFSMKADATYVGECSAEEIAKETKRWNEKNPS